MTNDETNVAAPEGDVAGRHHAPKPSCLCSHCRSGGAFGVFFAATRQIRAAQHRQLEAGSSNDAAGGGNKQSAEDFVFPGCICGIFTAARGSTECALMAACFGGNA
ncbi:MAG: hypothetical protein J0I99_19925 [Devosia sp.]|uniref:hypothetical protein n=1 Tax=Devosia sp. TaxID=1871048 RepID=UPI001ACE8D9B|nr:hypothetical protein [Devosia sp.]MBN9318015.1 hypothetical protein [Devosia sp.]